MLAAPLGAANFRSSNRSEAENMDWRDEGILLGLRRHGESGAIIDVLTPSNGRHSGYVRGGAGRRYASTLQPGNQLQVEWHARSADQLGNFEPELIESRSDTALSSREALTMLDASRALLTTLLPEREPAPRIYEMTLALMAALPTEALRRRIYAHWEITLLGELGFAIDLGRCGATGSRDNLCFVSPRTGRAVSFDAGEPYKDRLLPLPPFLIEPVDEIDDKSMADALSMTGHFLSRWAGHPLGHSELPASRERLAAHFTGN